MSWTGHSATEEQGGVKGSDQCHGLDLVLQKNRGCYTCPHIWVYKNIFITGWKETGV